MSLGLFQSRINLRCAGDRRSTYGSWRSIGFYRTLGRSRLSMMVQEHSARLERRLAAILAADVAGYSRLMHAEEEATHMRLTVLLTNVVDPAITEHGGRIVKNTGDGLLAEFPSAVEATRAALQFQNRIEEISVHEPEDRRILIRVEIGRA